ncbi:uncharacterized protein K02A2.6-like [Cydia pomonella]|uniref:uncharacterized protein K02A2.6-like n=1 Tax=Cydia pomonella TaxID=82600 RepID=UPI002ADD4C04|nr:uncharacterized protein K02A2.6-like [Cydia pomonella]
MSDSESKSDKTARKPGAAASGTAYTAVQQPPAMLAELASEQAGAVRGGASAESTRGGTSAPLADVEQVRVRPHRRAPTPTPTTSRAVATDEISDCEELIIQGVEILSVDSKGWFESVAVNGVPVTFKLDSGADACVMSRDSFRAAGYSEDILSNAGTILREGIGRLPGVHKLTVDESVPPVVRSSRKIPIKLRPRLREELDRLHELGIIEPVDEPTDWVSSIVLVEKPDGKLRLCIDPQNLNKAIKRSHFQLPTLDEVTANLSGAKYFSHLDANKGFYMIVLDDYSSKLCTFATPFGRWKFLRLPFGICSASEVFHNAMVKIFSMEGVECFIDDLLVYGRTKEEHDSRLEAVLQRALDNGVRFNKEKCVLGVEEVKYLGHVFDSKGMRPDGDRVKAIRDMPPPSCRKDLERFLGMTNYVSRFLPNYAELVEPLRGLLKRDSEFQWYEIHTSAFERVKKCLMEAPTLRYYDPGEAVVVSVDASSRGLGACLLQSGRPVAFAARTLTPAETRWAQIEKELLAILFGCQKFHQFIYGHKSVLVESDHKPLEAIFRKALNDTPVRLQRMLLRLQKYSIEIKYVPGRLMYVADTLSRAPTDDACDEQTGSDIDVHVNALYDSVNFSSDKLKKIKEETDKEPGLGNVRQYCLKGWPHTKNILESEAKPYWGIKEELHVIKGIVFRGNRVVIPTSLRKEMLHRIHEGHLGIEKCKYRARDVMWWPGMSAQVEALVAACATCAERRAAQPREPMRSHQVPGKPWEVLATDLFEFRNKHYILVVDYYSKYVEVVSLSDIRSETIIIQLKSIFARHGIPKKLVSDNGRQFTSAVFQSFVEKWEFEHVTSSPYYSRSNGLAERNVQTVKKLMEKAQSDGTDPYLALLNFRNTPVSGESYSPAQLLMARRLNTRLPVSEQLLAPKYECGNQTLAVKHDGCQHESKVKRLNHVPTGYARRMAHDTAETDNTFYHNHNMIKRLSKTRITDVGGKIAKLKWDWVGHVCRMHPQRWAK